MAVEEEQNVLLVAELEAIDEDFRKRILFVQRQSYVVVSHHFVQAPGIVEPPEQGVQIRPSSFDLVQRKAQQLLDVSVQYQREFLGKVVLFQHVHEQLRILQEVVPPAPVSYVEIAEHDQSIPAAQFDLWGFVVEGLQRTCDWILHQGLGYGEICFHYSGCRLLKSTRNRA